VTAGTAASIHQPDRHSATLDPASLTPADLAAFGCLGIPPELVAQAHLQRVTDCEAREYGITGRLTSDMSGILFPYFSVETGARITARVRRDNPEIEDGKPKNKYISAYGDRRHLYFVPGCDTLLRDTTVPIVLVEAEKSALAVTAWVERTGRRILPVAMGGCWGWRGRIGKVENSNGGRVDEVGPIPDLRHCTGRKVYVLLDANAGSNSKVQQAQAALVRQLQRQMASVVLLSLPASEGVNGPDDYLALLGDEAMARIFDNAEAGAAVLDNVFKFYCKFMKMSEAQVTAFTLWTVHTHAMPAADATPYMNISSAEKQSGKTMLMEAAELLVFEPWLTGHVTAACLVRKIDAKRPALLLDESDAAFNGDKEYAEVLRGLLNTGYRRGGQASCCVGQGANITFKDFSTFCPKAIAGIGKLPDTIADRSIPIRLKRKIPGALVERFRRRDVEPEANKLRDSIAAWISEKLDVLRSARPILPEELSDRQQDVCEPLFAIADLAGAEWPAKTRKALVELCTGNAAEDDSLGVRLLADIKVVFIAENVQAIPSAVLIKLLVEMEDRPWAEIAKGKPLTTNKLAAILRRYEVEPRTVRVDAQKYEKETLKGYERNWFADLWNRYLPGPPSLSLLSETSHPSQTNIHEGPVRFSKASQEGGVTHEQSTESSLGMPVVTAVTDSTRGPALERKIVREVEL
jgi:Protein of unknown function (DUF3631)/Domain of unknown function (DUF3854)